MRVGELLANDGMFEGNQFTPPRYVTLMLTPTHKDSPRGFLHRRRSLRSRGCGLARRRAEQRLWIVPSLRLRDPAGRRRARASEGWDEAMIPDSIIRGTSGWHPRRWARASTRTCTRRTSGLVPGRDSRDSRLYQLFGCRAASQLRESRESRPGTLLSEGHLGFEDLDCLADDPHAVELAVLVNSSSTSTRPARCTWCPCAPVNCAVAPACGSRPCSAR